jgi:hypothetical protein
VRRVKRLNPKSVPAGQGALFSIWRHHAVFTDSREPMLAAEAAHRDHAIIEQVFADLKSGRLTRLPSGRINANGAWLVLAAIAFNLTRAAGFRSERASAHQEREVDEPGDPQPARPPASALASVHEPARPAERGATPQHAGDPLTRYWS